MFDCCPQAVTLKANVDAGRHDRCHCPLSFDLGRALPAGLAVKLCEEQADGSCGRAVPVQWCDAAPGRGPTVSFIVDELGAGEVRRYKVHIVDASEAAPAGADFGAVTVTDQAGQQVDFEIGGELFTSYICKAGIARPYCYPVIGPDGVEMTSDGPADHRHHRSMYIAHGEVNGHDNWSEEKGHAKTVNREISVVSQGPVFGMMAATNDWVTAGGDPLLQEIAAITVWNLPVEGRLIDWRITWSAAYRGVFLGDTKEAGTLSVRVAEPLEGAHTGLITNAYGGLTEAETWGKRAPWCDYSGQVEGHEVGLAIFDYPGNPRYPTHWHVRDYGLFTANQWGRHDFTGDWSQRGDYAIPQGDCLHFRFRVYVHAGDVEAAHVASKFHDWINPPQVSVTK